MPPSVQPVTSTTFFGLQVLVVIVGMAELLGRVVRGKNGRTTGNVIYHRHITSAIQSINTTPTTRVTCYTIVAILLVELNKLYYTVCLLHCVEAKLCTNENTACPSIKPTVGKKIQMYNANKM
jgi:hypothetical protein